MLFALRKAVEEVDTVIKSIAQKKRIAVGIEVSDELDAVTLDQHKFKQVLYNLLSNAVKFSDEGGQVDRRPAHRRPMPRRIPAGRSPASRQITNADLRTNEHAIAVARGQAELPPFVAKGKSRWQKIRHAYSQAAAALDAIGQSEDRTLASDVRGFLDKHPKMNATPEIFAGHHKRNLASARPNPCR